jgi:hypothetical protein
MAMIRFNMATKEITVEGSESFVEGNFDTIRELVTASYRAGEKQGRRPRPKREIPVSTTKGLEPRITVVPAKQVPRRRQRRSGTPVPESLEERVPESPPVRKYILRKTGKKSAKEPVGSPKNEEGTGRVSIESMKANLGLTEQQVMEILREGEKQGRVKRDVDGSYVWV